MDIRGIPNEYLLPLLLIFIIVIACFWMFIFIAKLLQERKIKKINNAIDAEEKK